jgi:DNA ligase-1
MRAVLMSVTQILAQLEAEPGKNAKLAILKENANNKELVTVLSAALDLTKNYWLKQIPEYTPNTGKATLTLMDAIAAIQHTLTGRVKTGDDARAFLKSTLELVSADDALIIVKIIDRDLRCGVGQGSVGKVFKKLLPAFPYMRCSLPKNVKLKEYTWKSGVFSQLKADGMYANCNITDDGDINIVSRSGTDIPLTYFTELVNDALANFPKNSQTHGELLVARNGEVLAREIGNGILNKIAKGGEFEATDEPMYLVWDQIPLSGATIKGKYEVGYGDRYANLVKQTNNTTKIELIETRIVHNFEEALEHYCEKLDEGLEGTIIKCATGGWKDGTSKFQCKMKLDVDVDLEIVGYNAGKGKNEATFGSIECKSSDGKVVVNVSGFKDKARKEIHAIREELVGTIMTVKSNNLLPPSGSSSVYSLFLPRFAEFREDKFEADDLQKVQDQFDNAIQNVAG